MIIILCTTSSIESAKEIANILIKECYAACVNILPKITSVYKWNDKIITDEEYLLIIKTKKKLYKDVENKIKLLHPYEVPEIIAINIEKGSEEYINYIANNCN